MITTAPRVLPAPSGLRLSILLVALLGLGLLLAPPFAAVAEEAPSNEPPARTLLASVAWPPFSADEGNERVALDIVHEALSRAGIQNETLIIEDGKVTDALKAGTYDGSAAMWRSPEREQYLLFSEPYLENQLVLVGRKGAPVKISSLSELHGTKVGIVSSYAYGSEVTEAVGPVFVPGRNDQENLDRLLAGEIDVMLCDELIVRYTLDRQGSEAAKFLDYGTTTLIRRPLHLAVRKNLPGAQALLDRFNDAVQTMLADGTFNRILRLAWIQADADGDGTLELIPHGPNAGPLPTDPTYTIATGTAEPKLTERYWINGEIVDSLPESEQDPDVQAAPWPEPGVTEFVVWRLRF
ncbi:MAG: transporter substrate-binding domain-containing protein [Acidobacteriota bacterium]